MTAGENRFKLVGLIGAAATATLVAHLVLVEDSRNVPYQDTGGVWTACVGSTKDVDPNKVYSDAECEQRLYEDAVAHVEGVKRCVTKPMTDGQAVAFGSFAFNVGVSRFCNSTLVKKFNAGDAAGACAELSRWTKVNGKELRGLVKRRAIERKWCESGVTEKGLQK